RPPATWSIASTRVPNLVVTPLARCGSPSRAAVTGSMTRLIGTRAGSTSVTSVTPICRAVAATSAPTNPAPITTSGPPRRRSFLSAAASPRVRTSCPPAVGQFDEAPAGVKPPGRAADDEPDAEVAGFQLREQRDRLGRGGAREQS